MDSNHVKSLILILLLFVDFQGYSQIDIAKYANQDLFEIKPVISEETLAHIDNQYFDNDYDYQVAQAYEFISKNEPNEALNILQVLIKEIQEVAGLHYLAGYSYYLLDSVDLALVELKLSLQYDPLFYDSNYLIGMIYISENQTKEARIHLDKLIDVPAYEALGWYGRGMLEAAEGNPYRSKSSFVKCIKSDKEFSDAYLPLGLISMYQGQYKKTMEYLNTAVELNDTWQEAIIIRGIVAALIDENLDQFEADIERLLILDPDNYHYQSIKGYLEMERQNYGEALNKFRIALNMVVDTTSKGSYKFSTRLKKDQDLQYLLNTYLLYKTDIDLEAIRLMDVGLCEFLNGNYKISKAYIDSVKIIGEFPLLYYWEGLINENRYLFEKAVESYTSVIEKDPENAPSFKKRSAMYYLLDKVDLGLQDLNSYIRLEPKKKFGYKSRGIHFLDQKVYHRAYVDFTRCTFLDSTDVDVFYNRALAAAELGHFDKAQQDLDYLITLEPNDDEAYYTKGFFYERVGALEEAMDAVDMALDLDSEKKYFLLKGNLLLNQEQYILTIVNYTKALEELPWAYTFFLRRAEAYYKMQNYQDAHKDLKEYLKHKSGDGEAHYYMGKVCERLGKSKLATKHLETASVLGYLPN